MVDTHEHAVRAFLVNNFKTVIIIYLEFIALSPSRNITGPPRFDRHSINIDGSREKKPILGLFCDLKLKTHNEPPPR